MENTHILYHCLKCDTYKSFRIGNQYSTICPNCNNQMIFVREFVFDVPDIKAENGRVVPIVKCPYCESTDCKKVSTASRIVSTGFFGLGSKKVGKQWHCKNCDSYF